MKYCHSALDRSEYSVVKVPAVWSVPKNQYFQGPVTKIKTLPGATVDSLCPLILARALFVHVYLFFNENAMLHHPHCTSKAWFCHTSRARINMKFHDFRTCWASKSVSSRRSILNVDFCVKTPTGVTILLAKHQNHQNTQGNCRFFERWRVDKKTPPNHQILTSLKRYKNNGLDLKLTYFGTSNTSNSSK